MSLLGIGVGTPKPEKEMERDKGFRIEVRSVILNFNLLCLCCITHALPITDQLSLSALLQAHCLGSRPCTSCLT